MSEDRGIAGFCPMGCGQTLFVADGGYITCSFITCPRPTAVAELLGDQETEHIVQFDFYGVSTLHPLRERLDQQLLTCEIHNICTDLGAPGGTEGRYRIQRTEDDTLTWNLIPWLCGNCSCFDVDLSDPSTHASNCECGCQEAIKDDDE